MRAPVSMTLKGGVRGHVLGHRVHHGLIGELLVLTGLALMGHDRRDWRHWLADARVSETPRR